MARRTRSFSAKTRAVCLALILLVPIGPVPAFPDPARAAEATSGEGLAAMLARVPADLPELDDPDDLVVSYASPAAQRAALGDAAPGAAGTAAWAGAAAGLPWPRLMAQFGQELAADFGLDAPLIDQTLEVAAPPFSLTLYRGRFDPAAVRAALGALGYASVGGGGALLAVRGDYVDDLRGRAAYATSRMNYAVFLADGTLAFAPALAIAEAVLAVGAGDAPPLSERADVAALLAYAPGALVGALLVPGSALAALAPVGSEPGEAAGAAPLPPVAWALLATTPGAAPYARLGATPTSGVAAPVARAVALLLTATPGAAEEAAGVIADRLATLRAGRMDRSFAALFPERGVAAVPGAPIVRLELALGPDAGHAVWRDLADAHDLRFLAP